MGGKVYDRRPLIVDRDPLKQLATEVGNLKKLDPIDMLEHWVEQVRDFVAEAIKRVTGIDLLALAPFMSAIGLNVSQTPEQVWQHITQTFLNPLAWLGRIPIGALSSATPNLLADFISAESLVGETVWVYDPNVEPAGAVGSVRITFDGAIHELISERILLDVGRKVDASVKIKYSGVTAPNGSPIRLSWIGWNGDAEVAGGDLAVHQPSGAALDWTTLSGSLTRLDSDPWDRVSIVLKTTAGATAGTGWFGAPSAKKPDKLPKNLVDGLESALAAAGQTIRDAICNALGIGGSGHTDADVIRALTNIPKQAVQGVEELADQVGDGFKSWWNHWFNRTDGDGSAAQIQQVAESIRDAVLNGYNVHTVTANETNWPVPSHTEAIIIAIGGGEQGQGGINNTSAIGRIGGRSGSYIAQPVNLTGVAALDTQIGTQGNKSYVRVANTTTPHTGTVVLASPDLGTVGSIAGPLGYTPTSSTPGRGGNGGGMGTGRDLPQAGESSALGAGGAPGGNNGTWGTPGQPGGSVSAGSATKCGGGGGGGGGAAVQSLNVGGNGGDGGYPGGGGGAGGNCNGTANQVGRGGAGAIGVVFILIR